MSLALINLKALGLLMQELNDLAERGLLNVWDCRTLVLRRVVSTCINGRSIQLNVGGSIGTQLGAPCKDCKECKEYFLRLHERTSIAAYHNLLAAWFPPPGGDSSLENVKGAVVLCGQCIQINLHEEPIP